MLPMVSSRNSCGYRVDVRLEPLSVFRWSYDEDGRVGPDGATIVSPYGSEEGIVTAKAVGPPAAGLRAPLSGRTIRGARIVACCRICAA